MFVMESAVTLTIKIMYKVFNTKYLIDIQIFYIEVDNMNSILKSGLKILNILKSNIFIGTRQLIFLLFIIEHQQIDKNAIHKFMLSSGSNGILLHHSIEVLFFLDI